MTRITHTHTHTPTHTHTLLTIPSPLLNPTVKNIQQMIMNIQYCNSNYNNNSSNCLVLLFFVIINLGFPRIEFLP